MSTSVEKFREFVKKYPKLRNLVKDGTRTWQSLYEDWVILGDNDSQWFPFSNNADTLENNSNNLVNKEKEDIKTTNSNSNSELISGIMSLVKSVNPDSINKALTMTQKASQIIQGFSSLKGSGKTPSVTNHYDPFFRKF